MNVPQVQNTRTASRRRNRLQNRIRQNRKLGLIAAFVIGIAIFCYIRPSSMFGLIFSPLKGGKAKPINLVKTDLTLNKALNRLRAHRISIVPY